MNGESHLERDINKRMMRRRMRVQITEVTAKTCHTDKQPLRAFKNLQELNQ